MMPQILSFWGRAGPRHSLALGADGSVWAWGDNGGGQLGTGTTVNRPAPVRVTGLPPAAAIAAGGDTSVAVARDGSVWAWGDNTFFAIGNPAVVASAVPLQVAGVQGIVGVGAGARHMLTLGSDGRVRGWGAGGPGQLGDGRSMDSAAPVTASGLPRAVRIAAGGNLSLAISAEVDVLGWGSSGGLGELAAAHNPTPVTIASLGHATAVSAGGDHSLAIGPNGSAWGWGSNIHGQLGVEPAGTIQHTAMLIPSFPSGLVALQAGQNHSLALDANGGVHAWGNNVGGQLGDGVVGAYMTRTQPLQVTLPGPAAAIAAGSYHSLALLRDGTVQAWGGNTRGEIGDGTATGLTPNVGEYIAPFYRPRPGRVLNLTSVQRIAAGSEHSLALRSDGTVWTWGENLTGQLGSGTTGGIRAAPAQMTGLTGVTAIAAESFHNLALKSDGTVWAWGANFSGQLGNGTVGNPVASPVRVPGLTAVVAIAAGDRHSLALRSDGTVWTWGGNLDRQLGSGIVDARRATPAPVPGLTGIAAGRMYCLAIRSSN